MLGAQSVSRSTDTSAETTTPLAEISIHDRLVKASPLVYQMRFISTHRSRRYSRLVSDAVNSVATVLDK